jgi:hypothetical protein
VSTKSYNVTDQNFAHGEAAKKQNDGFRAIGLIGSLTVLTNEQQVHLRNQQIKY